VRRVIGIIYNQTWESFMSCQDTVEIINTINLYPVAVDSLSFDLFDLIFTEDAFVDFGGPAQWSDLASLKRDFIAIHQPFRATQHKTGNHRVTVSGDGANALSYVHACFVREVGGGGDVYEARGWYDDTLVRTAEGWRISRRVARNIAATGNEKVLQTMPGVTVDLTFDSLSVEAAAGRVAYIEALRQR
jgi:hypothetical protein